MEFDWDEHNVTHLAHHNVSTEEAESVLDDDTVDVGVQQVDGEERIAELGLSASGRFLVVVTTELGTKLRVVTAYDPEPRLIHLYFHREG